jgi:hypothetical protein
MRVARAKDNEVSKRFRELEAHNRSREFEARGRRKVRILTTDLMHQPEII